MHASFLIPRLGFAARITILILHAYKSLSLVFSLVLRHLSFLPAYVSSLVSSYEYSYLHIGFFPCNSTSEFCTNPYRHLSTLPLAYTRFFPVFHICRRCDYDMSIMGMPMTNASKSVHVTYMRRSLTPCPVIGHEQVYIVQAYNIDFSNAESLRLITVAAFSCLASFKHTDNLILSEIPQTDNHVHEVGGWYHCHLNMNPNFRSEGSCCITPTHLIQLSVACFFWW
jgi:hypothetical protein